MWRWRGREAGSGRLVFLDGIPTSWWSKSGVRGWEEDGLEVGRVSKSVGRSVGWSVSWDGDGRWDKDERRRSERGSLCAENAMDCDRRERLVLKDFRAAPRPELMREPTLNGLGARSCRCLTGAVGQTAGGVG